MAVLATAAAAVAAAAAAVAVASAVVVPATVIPATAIPAAGHPPAPVPRDLTAGATGRPRRPEWVRTVQPAGSHGAAAAAATGGADAGSTHGSASGCGGTQGSTSTPPPLFRSKGVLVPLTARPVARVPTGEAGTTATGADSRRTPGERLVDALHRLGRPWAAVPSGDRDRRGGDGAHAYGDGLEAFRSVLPAAAGDGGIGAARSDGGSRIDRRRVQSLPLTPRTVPAGGGGDSVSRPSVARRSAAAESSGDHGPSSGSTGGGSAEAVVVTPPPPPLVTTAPPVAASANWALPASLLITSPTANVGSLPPPPPTAAKGGGGWATTGLGKLTASGGATAAEMEASMVAVTQGGAQVVAPAVAGAQMAETAVAAPAVAALDDVATAVKTASTTPTGAGPGIKALAVEAPAAGRETQPAQATRAAGAPVAEPAVSTASSPVTAEPPATASNNGVLPESLLITSPTVQVGTFAPPPLDVVRGRVGEWATAGGTSLPPSSEAAAATVTRTTQTEMGVGIEAPVAATKRHGARGVAEVGAVMTPQPAGFTTAPPQGPREAVVAAPYGGLVPPAAVADPPAAARAATTVAMEPQPTVPDPLTPLSPTPRLPTSVPLPPPMFVRVGSAPTATIADTAAASTAAAAAAVTTENPPDGSRPVLASAPVTSPTAAADTAAEKGAPTSVTTPLMSLSTAAAAAPSMAVVAQAPPLPLQALPETAAVARAVGGGVPPRATQPLPTLAVSSGQPALATTTATPAVGLTAAPTAALPPQTELPLPVTVIGAATRERGPAPPSLAMDYNSTAAVASIPAATPEVPAMPAAAVPASAAEVVAADETTRPRAVALAAGARARRGLLRRAGQRLAAAVAALSTDNDATEAATGATAEPRGTRVVMAAA